MSTSKKAAFYTLGCKLNYSETSSIARLFQENGYQKVDFEEKADVYVINTCSVTENANKECKQIVKSAILKSPEAFVVIIGCYAQLKPEAISRIEGVDLVLGTSEKFKLLNYLHDLNKKPIAEIHACEIEEVNTFINAYSVGDRTRAFLKVQDGCNYTCSYCTIPLARGKSRSNDIASVLKNVQEIAEKGIKEIVLTGVNIGDFGNNDLTQGINSDRKEQETFFDLIKALDTVKAIERFRISSIEPNLLKTEIIQFVAAANRFVPHFHIPLQSGSNKILGLMQRRYQRELYAEKITTIKKLMPHCCIGVDVIVGFPGETEEDFLETYNFITELDLSYLHVFTYSERENTLAAKSKAVVPINVRKRRNKMLRILSAKKQRLFYEQHIGSNRTVLFEQENKGGFMYGFTDNYIKIKMPYDVALIKQLRVLKLTEINPEGFVLTQAINTIATN